MSIQNERLIRLASFLEGLPPEKYDHGMYHCGTRGCALGWAVVEARRLGFADIPVGMTDNYVIYDKEGCGTGYDAADRYFGAEAVTKVFMNLGRKHDGTPRGAAKACRELVASRSIVVGQPTHIPCDADFKLSMDDLLLKLAVAA